MEPTDGLNGSTAGDLIRSLTRCNPCRDAARANGSSLEQRRPAFTARGHQATKARRPPNARRRAAHSRQSPAHRRPPRPQKTTRTRQLRRGQYKNGAARGFYGGNGTVSAVGCPLARFGGAGSHAFTRWSREELLPNYPPLDEAPRSPSPTMLSLSSYARCSPQPETRLVTRHLPPLFARLEGAQLGAARGRAPPSSRSRAPPVPGGRVTGELSALRAVMPREGLPVRQVGAASPESNLPGSARVSRPSRLGRQSS